MSNRAASDAAFSILAAVQAADPAKIERMKPPAVPAGAPPELAERLEAIQAVAGQLRGGLSRLRRGTALRWEGAEVCLDLLRHLAQETPEERVRAAT